MRDSSSTVAGHVRAAWAAISGSGRRAALAAAVATSAVVVGVAFAVAVGGVREPSGIGQARSEAPASAKTFPASSAPSASATPSPSATPSASPTPSPSPEPSTASVVATPPATPSPLPVATPALPTATPWPTPAPGTDAEEACVGFQFADAPITVESLADLRDSFVGTWSGCVTTPWVEPYWVTITFRDDGTYSSHALAGSVMPAFYYGSDEDSPEKVYELNDLQDDLEGVGQIDIFFWAGNVNRGELRNVALIGNQLEFEFFHRSQYGPLTYQLYRRDSTD